MDLLIFVDSDDDIRLARRSNFEFEIVYRDIRERGRNLTKVLERYMKFVKPAFDEYIKPVILILILDQKNSRYYHSKRDG